MKPSRLRCWLACAAILSLAGCGTAPAGGESTQSRLDQAALLAASCSGCHAAGGSATGIASLDGISARDLQARLLAYRNDDKGDSAMHRMARGYTEQQLALIAGRLGE